MPDLGSSSYPAANAMELCRREVQIALTKGSDRPRHELMHLGANPGVPVFRCTDLPAVEQTCKVQQVVNFVFHVFGKPEEAPDADKGSFVVRLRARP